MLFLYKYDSERRIDSQILVEIVHLSYSNNITIGFYFEYHKCINVYYNKANYFFKTQLIKLPFQLAEFYSVKPKFYNFSCYYLLAHINIAHCYLRFNEMCSCKFNCTNFVLHILLLNVWKSAFFSLITAIERSHLRFFVTYFECYVKFLLQVLIHFEVH